MLFRQGPLSGPKLIMEYQRGEISDENLEKAWEDAVQSNQAVEKKPDKLKHPCGVCGAELLAADFSFTLPGCSLAAKSVPTDVIVWVAADSAPAAKTGCEVEAAKSCACLVTL